jgi:hypothetical protein
MICHFSCTLAVLGLLFAPAAAQAAPRMQSSGATCSLTTALGLNPGLTLSSDSGTISSDGLRGTLSCVRVISGAPVTGTGKFGVGGTYQGSCVQGTTSGVAPFEVPTSAGMARGAATYTVIWVATVGQVTASGANYGFAPGPFAFLPATQDGDCVGQPLSSINWQGLQLVIQS